MKIVKKKQWHKNKKKKKFACNIKLKKNVILYLNKMWLCMGLVDYFLLHNRYIKYIFEE